MLKVAETEWRGSLVFVRSRSYNSYLRGADTLRNDPAEGLNLTARKEKLRHNAPPFAITQPHQEQPLQGCCP
jgi:hypothetical protein